MIKEGSLPVAYVDVLKPAPLGHPAQGCTIGHGPWCSDKRGSRWRTRGPLRAPDVNYEPDDRKVMTPARWEKMWTVHELAECAGVSAATVYHWRVLGKRPEAIEIGSCLRYRGDEFLKSLHERGNEVA